MKIKNWMISLLRLFRIGKKVRKSVPTYYKYATQKDYETGFVSPGLDKQPTKGVIETLEGPDTFNISDIICKGWIKGEFWKLSQKRFDELKITVIEPAGDDWGQCVNKNTARAIRIPISFTIEQKDGDPLTSKPGDFLLFDNSGYWPLASGLLPTTYKAVK